jgi:hypothetical protein
LCEDKEEITTQTLGVILGNIKHPFINNKMSSNPTANFFFLISQLAFLIGLLHKMMFKTKAQKPFFPLHRWIHGAPFRPKLYMQLVGTV